MKRNGLSGVRVVNLKQPLIFKVLHRGSRLLRQANLIAQVNWILGHQEEGHLAFQLHKDSVFETVDASPSSLEPNPFMPIQCTSKQVNNFHGEFIEFFLKKFVECIIVNS